MKHEFVMIIQCVLFLLMGNDILTKSHHFKISSDKKIRHGITNIEGT